MEFESRESFRVDSDNFASYRLFNSDDQVIYEGVATVIDISRTGVAFLTKYPAENGLKIELAIGVGDELVRTTGRIRNQKSLTKEDYQVGVEFDFLSEDDLDKLATVYPDITK
jgi:hypothetical protein